MRAVVELWTASEACDCFCAFLGRTWLRSAAALLALDNRNRHTDQTVVDNRLMSDSMSDNQWLRVCSGLNGLNGVHWAVTINICLSWLQFIRRLRATNLDGIHFKFTSLLFAFVSETQTEKRIKTQDMQPMAIKMQLRDIYHKIGVLLLDIALYCFMSFELFARLTRIALIHR